MDIILKLTIRHMKKNKKRTISAITGISAASVLLTLSSIFITSYLQMLENSNAATADIAPLMTAAAVMMAIILAVLVIFIYNMLAISARDRISYLGMLGSVGATPFQRGEMALLEAVILGAAAILPGILVGTLLSFVVFPFQCEFSWKSLLLIFLCESVTVLFTGLVQTWQSGRGRVIGLIQNKTNKRNLQKPVVLPGWILSRFGVEGHLSMKNMVFFKRRYIAIGISFVISMVLFLDGYIYMNYLDGYYEVRDRRENTMADLIVEEEYGKRSEVWNDFIADVAALPEVEEYQVSEQAGIGGVLVNAEDIKSGMETFSTYVLGSSYRNPTIIYDKKSQKKSGYCMDMLLIGLDDAAFTSILKQTKTPDTGTAGGEEIPVLIEDFPLVKNVQGLKYQSILDIEKGAALRVWTDVNYALMSASSDPVTGFEQLNFHVLGVTDQPVAMTDVNEGVREEPNTLRFYTTTDMFDKFTQKHLPTEPTDYAPVTRKLSLRVKSKVPDVTGNILSPVITSLGNTISRKLSITPEGLSLLSIGKLQNSLRVRSDEVSRVQKEIERLGEKYGLSSGGTDLSFDPSMRDYSCSAYSYAALDQLSDPFPLLRHLFVYGVVAFLLIISVFQMIKITASAVQTRRREFAVFLSLGMSRSQLGRMIYMESLVCNLGAFAVGSVISVLAALILFWSWKQMQAVEMLFPYHLFLWEAAFFLILALVSYGISMRSVKKIDIIDVIKDETV